MRSLRGRGLLVAAVAVLAAPLTVALPVLAAAPAQATTSVVSLCPTNPAPGTATCFAEKVQSTGIQPMTAGTPAGFSPSDLQAAYSLPSDAGGSGETVYIVDAYDNPRAETDLAAYRTQFGLPPCTTANGCFKKLNQTGGTSPMPASNSGWAGEISLDLDMVSAVCPNCGIRLIEASNSSSGLYAAVQTAVSLGAKFVSMSWGGPEYAGELGQDSVFNHPGVLFAASTGDSGYVGGPSYPAMSPYVLAVGGTHLVRDSSTRGWTDTAWTKAGSGCSFYEPKPARQAFIPSTLCTGRSGADVSAVGDPATGVAVATNGGWGVFGGTSASAPIIAAAYALAGDPPSDAAPQTYPYSNTSSLIDVTSGSSGTCGTLVCNSDIGWDGPTGLGTPIGIAPFNGSGSDEPVISYLGGRIAPVTATPGLATSVSVTTFVPTGQTLASVAWKAGSSACSFADATAASTTVSCNASAKGVVKLSATLRDSAGHTATASGTLTLVVPTVKRAVTVRLVVDRQSGGASVCTGVSAPAVATVVDTATGQAIKGVSVAFSYLKTGSTKASSGGSATTAVDGTATRSFALTTAATDQAASKAVGPYLASTTTATEAVTVGTCTPSASASTDASAAWYGDVIHVSGSVTRTLSDGSTENPLADLPVTVVLQKPSVTVNGKTTTPGPITVASTTTSLAGTITASFKATTAGTLTLKTKASTGAALATVNLGGLTVSVPSSALAATAATTSVFYGQPVAITGTLHKLAATTTGLYKASVALTVLPPGATKATSLGSAITKSDGTFAPNTVPKVSGELWASYSGATGLTGTKIDIGPITVNSWTSAVTLNTSATSVVKGKSITVSGAVTRTGGGSSGAAPSVAVRIVLTPTTGTPVVLTTLTTNSAGAFSHGVVPKVSGTITARIVGRPGYTDASSTGKSITVA